MKNRYVILGASRGLGQALYQNLMNKNLAAQFLLVSRKINEEPTKNHHHTIIFKNDFSVLPVAENLLTEIKNFKPTHIIYCAGGGPYGNFETKKWSDHVWALNVNFLFPAELLHVLSTTSILVDHLKKVIFVGSAIAESQPDSKASSYAAAKHALKGLVTTVQLESTLSFKVKLFSPSYMLTDLLPKNSIPRLDNKAESIESAASRLAEFIDSNDNLG